MTSSMKKKVHPRKRLAYMLRAAVIDAKRIDGGHVPDTVLDIRTYSEKGLGVTRVCLAGAHLVFGRSLDPQRRNWTRAQWMDAWAINYMRNGDIPEPLRDDDKVAKRAMGLIRKHYDHEADRAPWPIYMEAAAILAGEI